MANTVQARSKLYDLIVSPSNLPSTNTPNPSQSSPAFTAKDLPNLHNLVFHSWISAEELLDASVDAVDHLNASVSKYRKYTDSDIFILVRARIAVVNKQVLELQQKDQDEKWEVGDKRECEFVVMIAMILRLEVEGTVRKVLKGVVEETRKDQGSG